MGWTLNDLKLLTVVERNSLVDFINKKRRAQNKMARKANQKRGRK